MKKQILTIVISLLSLQFFAQISFNESAPGVIEVAYGEEFSLYDPAEDNEVYLYMWVDQAQTEPELSMQYNDEWSDASGLVVLSLSDEGVFEGTIDFNTHNFIGEGELPDNTIVNDFNFILRNEAGDSQSVDILASSHGYSGTTTVNIPSVLIEQNSFYSNGIFYLNNMTANSPIEFRVYNALGKELYYLNTCVNSDSIQIDLSDIESEFAVVQVTVGSVVFTKKIVL